MAGTSIAIKVNDREVTEGLRRLAAAGRDLQPAMEAIGAALLFSTQQRFQDEAEPAGGKWGPLSGRYIKQRPDRAPPAPILRDTGHLYSSLTFLATPGEVEVGTNVVYAAIHQFGGEVTIPAHQRTATFRVAAKGAATTKDGRRVGSKLRFASAKSRAKSKHERTFDVGEHTIEIPARPYLGISEADKTRVLQILEHFLLDETGGTGAAP